MLRRSAVAAAALMMVFVLAPDVVGQGDIKPLVKKGEEAIDAKDYQAALDYFQQVVGKLQNLVEAAFETFMPKTLPGWEAGEIRSQSWAQTGEGYAGNMTNITQVFTRTSDGKKVTVNLSNWPHVVTGLKQSLEAYKGMESMMNMDPNTKITFDDRDGWTIMRIVDLEGGSTQIQAVGEQAMVSVEADYPDAKEADQYLLSMNLAGISKKAERPE
jgi:hypothetical protein